MALGVGTKCIKDVVFLFNLLFWLCGVALIVVGVLVQMSMKTDFMISNASALAAPIILILVGVSVVLITFFGCCGAWRENHCMVFTFACLLSGVVLIEIAAVVLGYTFKNQVTNIVNESLTSMLDNYNTSTPEFRASVDGLQTSLMCCGVNSSSDWQHFDADKNSVPDSCCRVVTPDCGKGAMTDASKIYTQGCSTVVEKFLQKNITWVIAVALITMFLQVMGIVFACVLMGGIRHS